MTSDTSNPLNPEKTIRALQKSLRDTHPSSLSPELSTLIVTLLDILAESITHKNALQILKLTVQYDLEELQERVLTIIAPDFDVFYSFHEILEFADKKLIKALLSRNDLKYDELRIYIELSEWVQRNESERWLLDLVRLPLIEPNQLMGRVVKEGLVTRERALEALVYAMGRRLGVDVNSYMDLVGERFSPRSPGKSLSNYRDTAEGFLNASVRDSESGAARFDVDNESLGDRQEARRESEMYYTPADNSTSSPTPSRSLGVENLVSPKELSSTFHRRHEEYHEERFSVPRFAEREAELEDDEEVSQDDVTQEVLSDADSYQEESHHHHVPDPVAAALAKKIHMNTLGGELRGESNSTPPQKLSVDPGATQLPIRSPHRLSSASTSTSSPQRWDVSFSPTQFWHQSPRRSHRYKIIVAGDSETGKSAWVDNLLARFDANDKTYIPTVGVSINKISFFTTEDFSIEFELWDVSGSDSSSGIRDGNYYNADGAILFFDVTSLDSYKNILKWKKEIINVCGHSISTVVVGTKIDQSSRRQVYLPQDEPDAFEEMSVTGDRQDTMSRPLERLARMLESNRTLEFQMRKRD